jgi:copper resistance protein C
MKDTRALHRCLLAAVFSCILLTSKIAVAHAILVVSTPSVHGSVKGPDVTIHLKFNSRIDGVRSRLLLADAVGKVETLTLAPQKSPDTLDVQSLKLSAGAYTIRWQALAADGHITRGEIPFTVQ